MMTEIEKATTRRATNSHPTVFVVDNEEAFRDSVSVLLESVGFRVAQFDSAQAFVDEYDPERPGCAIVDLRMPRLSGLALQELLHERGIGLPVIIVTAFPEVSVAVRAMKTGAFDFLAKPFPEQQLIDLVNRAIAADAERRSETRERQSFQVRLNRRTPRERQVLELVVAGKKNRLIADELSITKRTVELHRVQCMKKMRVDSLAELVAQYTRFQTSAPESVLQEH